MLQELRQGKRVSVFATNPVRKAIIRSVLPFAVVNLFNLIIYYQGC